MRIELLGDPSATAQDLRELLLLVGEDVPVGRIGGWAPLERVLVADWATREHFHASDNPVRRRPRPSLLGPAEKPCADVVMCQLPDDCPNGPEQHPFVPPVALDPVDGGALPCCRQPWEAQRA